MALAGGIYLEPSLTLGALYTEHAAIQRGRLDQLQPQRARQRQRDRERQPDGRVRRASGASTTATPCAPSSTWARPPIRTATGAARRIWSWRRREPAVSPSTRSCRAVVGKVKAGVDVYAGRGTRRQTGLQRGCRIGVPVAGGDGAPCLTRSDSGTRRRRWNDDVAIAGPGAGAYRASAVPGVPGAPRRRRRRCAHASAPMMRRGRYRERSCPRSTPHSATSMPAQIGRRYDRVSLCGRACPGLHGGRQSSVRQGEHQPDAGARRDRLVPRTRGKRLHSGVRGRP